MCECKKRVLFFVGTVLRTQMLGLSLLVNFFLFIHLFIYLCLHSNLRVGPSFLVPSMKKVFTTVIPNALPSVRKLMVKGMKILLELLFLNLFIRNRSIHTNSHVRRVVIKTQTFVLKPSLCGTHDRKSSSLYYFSPYNL